MIQVLSEMEKVPLRFKRVLSSSHDYKTINLTMNRMVENSLEKSVVIKVWEQI